MLGRLLGRGHYDRGFHSTATIGAVAAASCSAVLLRLDADATARAFGIAATQAAGLKAQFGTMCKPLHAGKANETGLVSAQLARRGFGSRRDILQCSQGFADALSPSSDPVAALAAPRSGAALLDNLFKFSAACFGTHGAIEAARQLRLEHGLLPDQVRHVEVRVEPGADRMCNIAAPCTGLQAKFSLTFNTALMLAGEDTASPAAYTDMLVRRADLCALRDRVGVRLMPDDWPLTLTELEVETVDGRVLLARHDTGRPAADLNAQGERLHAKFRALAVPVLGTERARELAWAIEAVDQMSDTRELMALVR
jgi:2-methylcitrate dehydratase PrpD